MAVSPNEIPSVRSQRGSLAHRLRRAGRRLLRGLWMIHPPVTIIVGANRPTTLGTLTTATRPSTDRLHLRDLFAGGRRYYIQIDDAGFRMTSDLPLPFGPRRRRSGRTALISASISGDADGATTFIRLRARMFIWQAVRAILWPALFATIILTVSWWDIALRIGIVLILLALSWTAHRADAALQASEMIFFVQKALEDLPPPRIPSLEDRYPDVITSPDGTFSAAWQRFYEQHQRSE